MENSTKKIFQYKTSILKPRYDFRTEVSGVLFSCYYYTSSKQFKLLCQVHFTKSNYTKKGQIFDRIATPMFSFFHINMLPGINLKGNSMCFFSK